MILKVDWQLPVKEDRHFDKMIHPKSKLHAFIKGESICGKYALSTEYYETTDVTEKDIIKNKQIACKKCLSKLKMI